jgi:hypothetical protein
MIFLGKLPIFLIGTSQLFYALCACVLCPCMLILLSPMIAEFLLSMPYLPTLVSFPPKYGAFPHLAFLRLLLPEATSRVKIPNQRGTKILMVENFS